MKRGNWTDLPCYYVSIIDGDKHNLVAGPFKTHKQALDMVRPARIQGNKLDPKSVFYGWGTAKRENGYWEGNLNKFLNI